MMRLLSQNIKGGDPSIPKVTIKEYEKITHIELTSGEVEQVDTLFSKNKGKENMNERKGY